MLLPLIPPVFFLQVAQKTSDLMKSHRGCQDLAYQTRLLYQGLRGTHNFAHDANPAYQSIQDLITQIMVYRTPAPVVVPEVVKVAPAHLVKKPAVS